jgi:hypothetical protein
VLFLDEYVNLSNPNQLTTAFFCRGIEDWPWTPWTCSIESSGNPGESIRSRSRLLRDCCFLIWMHLVSLRKWLVQYKLGKETKDLRCEFSDSIRSLPTRVSIGRFDWWVTPHRHQNSPEIMGLWYDQRPTMKAFVKAAFCLAIAPMTVGYMVKMNLQLTTVESVYIDLKLHILPTFQNLLQPWFKNMLIIMAILMLRMYI